MSIPFASNKINSIRAGRTNAHFSLLRVAVEHVRMPVNRVHAFLAARKLPAHANAPKVSPVFFVPLLVEF